MVRSAPQNLAAMGLYYKYSRKWPATSDRRRAFSLPSRLWTCDFVVATQMFNRRAISLSLSPLLMSSAVWRSRLVSAGIATRRLRRTLPLATPPAATSWGSTVPPIGAPANFRSGRSGNAAAWCADVLHDAGYLESFLSTPHLTRVPAGADR